LTTLAPSDILESDKKITVVTYEGRVFMIRWTLIFLVIAIIAAFFGFIGIAGAAIEIAKFIFYIFLVLFVISLILGFVKGRRA